MDFSVVHEDSYMLVFTVNDSPRAVVFSASLQYLIILCKVTQVLSGMFLKVQVCYLTQYFYF